MNILNAVILSIVQGITEFLPISSSGHLAILQNIFKLTENAVFFDIILHLGTLLSVIIFLWKDIIEIFVGFFKFRKEYFVLVLKVVIAEIPALIVGYFLNEKIKVLFVSPIYIGIAYFGTALILFLTIFLRKERKNIFNISYIDALIIGIFQCLALVPGFSRSGFTLFGALLIGLNKKDALKFSFLIAIPAIVGAYVFESLSQLNIHSIPINIALISFVISFLAGLSAIYLLFSVLKKSKLYIFGYYCLFLGILLLVWFL